MAKYEAADFRERLAKFSIISQAFRGARRADIAKDTRFSDLAKGCSTHEAIGFIVEAHLDLLEALRGIRGCVRGRPGHEDCKLSSGHETVLGVMAMTVDLMDVLAQGLGLAGPTDLATIAEGVQGIDDLQVEADKAYAEAEAEAKESDFSGLLAQMVGRGRRPSRDAESPEPESDPVVH